MKKYKKLLRKILETGHYRNDRTGVGTRSIFGYQMRFDLNDGFPILTTKKVHFKSVATELMWFLRGETNLNYLHQNGVSIWDEWADENGNLGNIYGKQWRNFGGCDQIAMLIKGLKENPSSRRHILSAWNVPELEKMALAPCHCFAQFYLQNNKLSCQVYMRSADAFLGVPFNIASYALLTHILAKETWSDLGELIFSFGDVHLYLNHIEQAHALLQRKTRSLPTLQITRIVEKVDHYKPEDFVLLNYKPHKAISAPIAV